MKMHTTTLFAFFLLCAFTSHLPSTTAVEVVDVDGETVKFNDQYLIVPVDRGENGRFGGVTITGTGNETCPLTVIMSFNPYSDGRPIIFSRHIPGYIVKEEDYLEIMLPFNLACSAATPSEWTAVQDEVSKKVYVKISGYANPIDGLFQIKRAPVDNGGYNLLFCPIDYEECFYLAVEDDDRNRRRLVIPDNETDTNRLVIQFKHFSDKLKATA